MERTGLSPRIQAVLANFRSESQPDELREEDLDDELRDDLREGLIPASAFVEEDEDMTTAAALPTLNWEKFKPAGKKRTRMGEFLDSPDVNEPPTVAKKFLSADSKSLFFFQSGNLEGSLIRLGIPRDKAKEAVRKYKLEPVYAKASGFGGIYLVTNKRHSMYPRKSPFLTNKAIEMIVNEFSVPEVNVPGTGLAAVEDHDTPMEMEMGVDEKELERMRKEAEKKGMYKSKPGLYSQTVATVDAVAIALEERGETALAHEADLVSTGLDLLWTEETEAAVLNRPFQEVYAQHAKNFDRASKAFLAEVTSQLVRLVKNDRISKAEVEEARESDKTAVGRVGLDSKDTKRTLHLTLESDGYKSGSDRVVVHAWFSDFKGTQTSFKDYHDFGIKLQADEVVKSLLPQVHAYFEKLPAKVESSKEPEPEPEVTLADLDAETYLLVLRTVADEPAVGNWTAAPEGCGTANVNMFYSQGSHSDMSALWAKVQKFDITYDGSALNEAHAFQNGWGPLHLDEFEIFAFEKLHMDDDQIDKVLKSVFENDNPEDMESEGDDGEGEGEEETHESQADVSINIEVTPEGEQLVDVNVDDGLDEGGNDFDGMDVEETFRPPSEDELEDMGIYSSVTAAIRSGLIGPDVPVDPEMIVEAWPQKWNKNKEIIGKDLRIQVADHPANIIMLEELPGKPIKRKVRMANYSPHPYMMVHGDSSAWLAANILLDAKFSTSMNYDQALKALQKALKKAAERYAKSSPEFKYEERALLGQDTRNYLLVEPADSEPMDVKGKDFTLKSEWTKFSAYDPGADFQSMDPSYTQYASSSPAAARKMFKILKADPTVLKSVSWSDFAKWMDKNKISYKINFSVYR